MSALKIVVAGTPIEGFVYHGPFDSFDEAEMFADTTGITGDWWITDLLPTTAMTTWEVIEDILDSIRVAQESGDDNILATVTDYAVNHYGDDTLDSDGTFTEDDQGNWQQVDGA